MNVSEAAADPATLRARIFAAFTWLLPFALVLFLGLRGGGYESIARDQVAVVLWCGLLLGGVTGVLPAIRVTMAAWVALALLTAFLAWTALSATWSESVERSLDTVPLIGAYLVVFVLAVMVSRREALVRILSAVGAAIAVLAALALLSRFVPGWSPQDETAARLPEVASRLYYPLGSWNGLAELLGMGVPLLLATAVHARTSAARILSVSAIPLIALAISYTISRGGVLVAVAGTLVFVALYPRRLSLVPVLGLAIAGMGAILFVSSRFDALKDLPPGFESEQTEMLLGTLAVFGAVALGMALLIAAEARGRIPELQVPPKRARRLLTAGIAVAAIGLATAGATGALSNAWERFKTPDAPGTTSERLSSGGGNQRYQQWDAALAAAAEDPLRGRGAGTYEYWWARTAPIPGYSRFAHSLYFETLAETGIVGLALVVALICFILVALVRRTLGSRGVDRTWLAAGTGTAFAFAITMALDWAWHIPVVAVVFFLVAGAGLQAGPQGLPVRSAPKVRWRLALAALVLPVLAFTVVSWMGAQRITDSQQAVADGDLAGALAAAEGAEGLEPWAATPHLQASLVLEQEGDLEPALAEVLIAIDKDFLNWEPRFVLARIEELRGHEKGAAVYFERARQLNPWSPIFLNDEDMSALTP